MFVWSSLYATNIPHVDEQHQMLFRMLNEISADVQNGASNTKNLDAAFDELLEYANDHFSEEEATMARYKVDERHTSVQRMEHHSFIYDIRQLRSYVAETESLDHNFESLIQFTTSWLVYHTLRTDLLMAAQVKAIQDGDSPEAAYEKSKTTSLSSEIYKPIVEALVHLWSDSNERIGVLEEELKSLKSNLESDEVSKAVTTN